MFNQQLSQDDLDLLYEWVDGLPLSRPKKNINRDFSDALMMAQTIHHYFPKIVDLHNYPGTNSLKSKMQNWKTLNTKVLSKLGLSLTAQQCQKIASATPMMIEILLNELRKICSEEGVREERQENQRHTQRRSFGKENDKMQSVSVSKTEQLKEILGLLKEKVSSMERTIQKKDSQIKQLMEILQMGGNSF